MPPAVQKTGSLFILGVYVTSLALAATLFFGREMLSFHDSKTQVEHNVEDIMAMRVSIGVLQDVVSSQKSELTALNIQMKFNDKRMDNCEAQHRKYHHGMKD